MTSDVAVISIVVLAVIVTVLTFAVLALYRMVLGGSARPANRHAENSVEPTEPSFIAPHLAAGQDRTPAAASRAAASSLDAQVGS